MTKLELAFAEMKNFLPPTKRIRSMDIGRITFRTTLGKIICRFQ